MNEFLPPEETRDVGAPGNGWDHSTRQFVLEQLGALPKEKRLDWVRLDQRRRWKNGQTIPIESYLELPPLADVELTLDLIFSEYLLCQELGMPASTDDFVRRFPVLEESLRRLFAVDLALMTVDATPRSDDPASSSVEQTSLSMIGKYPILSVLAEGGQGVVYRALHPTLSKEVVIKWSKQPIPNGSLRANLMTEGRLLARIEHPNLVRVFDLDFHLGRPYLVMEFVDAPNLEFHFNRNRMRPRLAAELVARIARALDVVHRTGIIHRDVNPRNILLDVGNQPRLIDFGLASWRHVYFDPSVDSGTLTGTLAYVPPEQARGEVAAVGPRSDVFGLGGVLYYLLTGQAPYRVGSPTIYRDATRGNWDRALLIQTAIPARLRAICTRALSLDPQDRHPTALELARSLESYLHRSQKIRRMATIAGALVLVCAFVGWRSLRSGEEKQAVEDKTHTPENGVATDKEAPPPLSKLRIDLVRDRNGKAFALENALPVVTDNELRFSMIVPAKRHAALLHFSEGKWLLVQQYRAEESPRGVTFPTEVGARVPLEGKPGPEFFLFCGRKGTPIGVADVQTMLGDLPAFPSLSNEQAFWTFNEQELQQWSRGVLGPPVLGQHPEDVAYRQLERIRLAILTQCGVLAGVLFVHKGIDD